MRLFVYLLLFFLFSCGYEDGDVTTTFLWKTNSSKNLDQEPEEQPTDTIPPSTSPFVISHNIIDYYHHFFETPLENFKELDYKEAYEAKTYVLNNLNNNRGYISFTTQNTPPEWDGDSETEWNYQITYWILPSGERIIGIATTKYTWVNESSTLEFYLHNKDGINEYNPLERNWNLGDFVSEDISQEFPDDFYQTPVVFIQLPENDKEIKIHLSYSDYEENQDLVDQLFNLNLTFNDVLINPMDGLIKRK